MKSCNIKLLVSGNRILFYLDKEQSVIIRNGKADDCA